MSRRDPEMLTDNEILQYIESSQRPRKAMLMLREVLAVLTRDSRNLSVIFGAIRHAAPEFCETHVVPALIAEARYEAAEYYDGLADSLRDADRGDA